MSCDCLILARDENVSLCPVHEAAEDLLKALTGLTQWMSVRFGYSTDPMNIIEDLEFALRVITKVEETLPDPEARGTGDPSS